MINNFYDFGTKTLLRHKKSCSICNLVQVFKDKIDRMILDNAEFADIESECNMYGSELTLASFISHKKMQHLLFSPTLYETWYNQSKVKLKELSRIQGKESDYKELKIYLDGIGALYNRNIDVIQAKQESLSYMHAKLLPSLLEAMRLAAIEGNGFKGMAGLARSIEVIYNKTLILEASIGDRLVVTPDTDESEVNNTYDSKKILDIIRASRGEV